MGTLIYLIRQGFENVWKNKIMFFASVLIISTSMITLGIFTIIGENVNALATSLMKDQVMLVYVKEGLPEEDIVSAKDKISTLNGVTEVKRITKEENIKEAREMLGEEYKDFSDGWEDDDIFTDSFEVGIESLEEASSISDEIKNIKVKDTAVIRSVKFDQDIFVKISNMSDIIKTIVLIVFILLVAVSLLVIANTIKLVLHSRRKEINIMKYIGATDAFVKTPFIIEGIIVGVVGAYISWLITIQIYNGVQNAFLSEGIVGWLDLSQRILNTNLIIGVGISCIACMISIKKYLDV